MSYDNIKADVNKFKQIALEEGLSNYCLIGSLVLELCLREKSIHITVILGYLIINNTYWLLHCWNKLSIEGQSKQIDVSAHPMFSFGLTKQYTLVLKDKWSTLTGSDDKRKDYDDLKAGYNVYLEEGVIKALEFAKGNCSSDQVKTWNKVIHRVKVLETFESIEDYLKFD